MKKISISIAVSLFVIFFTTSCWQYPIVGEEPVVDNTPPTPDPDPDPDPEPPDPTEIPLGFDYATSRKTNLMVDVAFTNGSPYAGAVFELFLENVCTASNKDTKRVMRFRVDQQGRLRSVIKLPAGLEHVYLCPLSSGLPTTIEVDVDTQNDQVRLVYNTAQLPGDAATNHDEFANDNLRFYNNYYPTRSTWSTLMYEDSWPRFDDYDMNDLVVDYRFTEVTNQNNDVVELFLDFRFRATCAGFFNGFAVEIPVAPTKITSVVHDKQAYFSGLVNTLPNGSEAGHTDASVIVVTDDITRFIPQFINCVNGGPKLPPGDLRIQVSFNEPIPKTDLGVAPYKPFLIAISGGNNFGTNRGMEIHLPNRRPTALANLSMLGTNDDDSEPSAGRYYVGIDRRNWAMDVHSGMEYYPTPNSRIDDAFLKFRDWAINGGNEYYDWMLNKPGYRNNSLLFTD